MTGIVDLIERAGRVTTTEDALAIIAEWERHVVETGKSPEEARAIVESNLGYLRQYLTEAEADRFFALASGEEYTPRIDEVSQLKARVAELEAQNAELLALRKAVRESQERFIEVRKATGSSTPLADFARLVALLEETGEVEILQDEFEVGSDDWLFIYRLFDKDNRG